MARIWDFLKLTRPLFLLGGMMLYLLGALVALVTGATLNLPHLVLGQALITSIQLMTHYTNEYFDQEGDRLNQNRTWFSGGSGVLAAGGISYQAVRFAAVLFALLGISLLALAALQVPAVLIFGLLGLVLAGSYSAPPLALARTGWGEFSASLVVALLVPLVGYTMQAGGRISARLLIICLPLILIHLAMLIAFQIPDYEADRAVGKRTLAVRLGLPAAARVHNLSLFLAFCVILGLSVAHWPGAQLAWLAFPLALWQALTIHRYLGDAGSGQRSGAQLLPVTGLGRFAPPRYFWLTLGAIGLFALTSALWLAGVALAWLQV